MTMKKKLEKKRVRRVQNGSKDLNIETPPRKKPGKDVFQLFSDKVRDPKDLESRWAVLQETRVEYFIGKGFVSFLKNHPELKDILEADKSLGGQKILQMHHAPDEAVRARYHKRVSNIIDDVLEWSPRLALSGMMEKPATVVNETETHSTNGNTSVSEEQVDQQDDMLEEPVYDQYEVDVELIDNKEDAEHHI
ncbi:hypothetical protein GIB67_005025 [Kingdonia uniflora]|uniref:Translocation protein SEC62 n=1 Tax=Kingdonia uniflora TaxID=39325 RepID=A0A7J7NN04_9MAGN|nr:hypothetical protein GIB67_005025 [Kingdonia uniflora]